MNYYHCSIKWDSSRHLQIWINELFKMSYCSTDYDSNYKNEVKICSLPVAVAPVPFQAGSGILISVLGLGVCPLSVFCVAFGGDPDILLTTHSGRPALVYLSSVLVQRLLLPLLYDQNFCGIGLEHKALQLPRRRATGWNEDNEKEGGNTWCGIRCCHI